MDDDRRSPTSWVVAIIVVAAIVGLLLVVRGPENQDRSGVDAPSAALSLAA